MVSRVAKEETKENLKPRPPVLRDGPRRPRKTSLLDGIRWRMWRRRSEAHAAHRRYKVQVGGKERGVLWYTPGHEAFTRMLARGAKVHDIVAGVAADTA